MRWQPHQIERRGRAPNGPDEFERWVDMVYRLPEIRLDKVAAVREALRRHCYDDSRIFEVAIDRLSREAGIL